MKTDYRKHSLIIGISLIIIAIIAGYSYGFAFNGFAAVGNQNFFYNTPTKARQIFLSGVVGWIGIFILDLVVSWGLCKYYQRVNDNLSILNAALRISYAFVLGLAILILALQSQVLSGEYTTSEKVTIIQFTLISFEKIWSYGLIVFGIHLIVWGYLSIKLESIHNIFGGLLIFGGFCYFFIHIISSFHLMSPEMIKTFESFLMLPMALAELGIAIRFIVKGLTKPMPVQIVSV